MAISESLLSPMKLSVGITGALVGCLFLAALELCLRQAQAFDPTVLPDPYMGFPGSGRLYREVTDSDGQVQLELSPNKASRYRGASFPRDKPEREFRVFCLGGSSVSSEHYKNPDGSFPHFLERYLRSLSQERQARVINSGGSGTGSIQNLEVLREVAAYDTDLIVLYPEGGEKNLIPPAPGGLLAKRDEQSPARVFARRHLAQLHTYCAARDLFARLLPIDKQSTRLPSAFSMIVAHALSKPFSKTAFSRLFELKQDRPPVLMPHPIPEVEIERANRRFRNSLHESVAIAREHDVALVLVLPQHNLEHSFYLRFHIDPNELRPDADGQSTKRLWRRRYHEGLELKRAGQHALALEVLESVRECYVEDRDDILAYYIAQCHRELGRPEEELRELKSIYERHPMVRELREIARAEGVLLVEPFDDLVAAAGGRVPGHDFFSDAYHPMPRSSRVIARAIAEAVHAEGLLPGSQGMQTARMQACEESCDDLLAKIKLPVHYKIFAAIRAADYDEAVRVAEAMPPKRFYGSPVGPFYLGWALTRAGRYGEARDVFVRLKRKFADRSLVLPDLSTDAGLVTHAFQGDVFSIF